MAGRILILAAALAALIAAPAAAQFTPEREARNY
jgi:hypothetical protein